MTANFDELEKEAVKHDKERAKLAEQMEKSNLQDSEGVLVISYWKIEETLYLLRYNTNLGSVLISAVCI